MVATTRKPPQPVTGVYRWAERLGPNDSAAVLEINGTLYVLYVREDDAGALLGYQLVKADGTCYDIDPNASHGWTCDCPDATYCPERPGGCKHVKALKAALAQLAPTSAA